MKRAKQILLKTMLEYWFIYDNSVMSAYTLVVSDMQIYILCMGSLFISTVFKMNKFK